MAESIVNSILILTAIYLTCGILFTIPFLLKGLNKIDEGTHGAGIGFCIIIIPGCIVFWPVLLKRWISAKQQNDLL